MGGWRFITTKTSSVAYSIYSATLQPQELEFLSFGLLHPAPVIVRCNVDYCIFMLCGVPAVNFIKKTSCIYSGNSIIYALLVGVVAQLV